jgi:hypothetical protein
MKFKVYKEAVRLAAQFGVLVQGSKPKAGHIDIHKNRRSGVVIVKINRADAPTTPCK